MCRTVLQSTRAQIRDRNLSLQSEELSLGPLVGGVSKLPSNHIQCRDWRGARPHLELIAADATQHKEMGCRGVDGVGWGYFSSESSAQRAVYALWQVPPSTQLRSCSSDQLFWMPHVCNSTALLSRFSWAAEATGWKISLFVSKTKHLNQTRHFDCHTDCHTRPQHLLTVRLLGSM